ncbi:MAG: ferritin-like domain-containing protein [Myxococcota bacterium]
MKYVQHNPLPIPSTGPVDRIPVTMATSFDWKYALERQNLLVLYEKGKAATWNATQLPWDTEVNMERIVAQRRAAAGGVDVFNQLMNPPEPLSPERSADFNLNMNAWLLSQFLHGEQGALVATAKIVQCVETEEAKFYAANQVADEARHVEVYHRYLTEKLGRSFEVNKDLRGLLDATVTDPRWDITYLGMQIMVEGLALAAFGMMKYTMPDEPLIQEITTRIMGDEARHVAFGVLSLEGLYTEGNMTEQELREREDFVIFATELMRDRLLMQQVFERMGLDEKKWLHWAVNTPFMAAFRQMLFSKIVPNLKRLGLLTPRVRRAYERLGLLRFEDGKDSTQEIEATPPAEFLTLVAQMTGQAPVDSSSAAH